MVTQIELIDKLEDDYYLLLAKIQNEYVERSIFNIDEREFKIIALSFITQIIKLYELNTELNQEFNNDINIIEQIYLSSIVTKAFNDTLKLINNSKDKTKKITKKEVKQEINRTAYFNEFGNGFSQAIKNGKRYYAALLASNFTPRGFVAIKEWHYTPNENTRHIGMDGQIREIREPFDIINDKTGTHDKGQYPRGPGVSASNGAICYCYLTYDIISQKEYEQRRN